MGRWPKGGQRSWKRKPEPGSKASLGTYDLPLCRQGPRTNPQQALQPPAPGHSALADPIPVLISTQPLIHLHGKPSSFSFYRRCLVPERLNHPALTRGRILPRLGLPPQVSVLLREHRGQQPWPCMRSTGERRSLAKKPPLGPRCVPRRSSRQRHPTPR